MRVNNSVELGRALAGLRTLAGMSQQHIADELELNKSSVARWEQGAVDLSVSATQRYLDVLGLEMEDLLAVVEIVQKTEARSQLDTSRRLDLPKEEVQEQRAS